MPDNGNVGMISLIIPCLDEAETVEACIRAVVAGDGTSVGEILVVDGGSGPDTCAILRRLEADDPRIRVLHNPRRYPASAFNIGIASASRPFVGILGAHAKTPPGYFEALLGALETGTAECVGGPIEVQPRRRTWWGRAAASATASRYGAGVASFRKAIEEPRLVDAVPYALWRTETLHRLGGFDERLLRSSDYDLFMRHKARGGSVVLIPTAPVTYYARPTFVSFISHNFSNGFWVGFPASRFSASFSLRHYLPGLLLGNVIGGAVLAIVGHGVIAALLAAPYAIWLGIAAAEQVRFNGKVPGGLINAVTLPLAIGAIHLPYGAGLAVGAVRGLRERARMWHGARRATLHGAQRHGASANGVASVVARETPAEQVV